MWNEIAAWQETLKERPDLSAKTLRSTRKTPDALLPGYSRTILASKPPRSHQPTPKPIETICLPNAMLPRPSIAR
jgi:hypothetical protein